MTSKELIFLGGIFPKEQERYIVQLSKGVVQNAADALQQKLLQGLDEVSPGGVVIVNLPFVGSYPKRFASFFFPKCRVSFGSRSYLLGMSFINFTAVKFASRFFSALFGLLKAVRSPNCVVIAYSAHLPFVLAAYLFKKICRGSKVCLVIPDLPEFMGEGGVLYSFLKRIDTAFFYFLVKKLDYFVVLTEHMTARLGVDASKSVVVEGVANVALPTETVDVEVKNSRPIFLYTGTLARRYGILDLLKAFELIDARDAELWICGDGDGRSDVVRAAALDQRIKFFGQVTRDESVKLQSLATFLVNPRPPEGEFTKYSFPSKIMEYMATGRPVVMYKLPGIPNEYDGLYYSPIQTGGAGLAECFQSVLALKPEVAADVGRRAKQFVLESKGPVKQAMRILNLIN